MNDSLQKALNSSFNYRKTRKALVFNNFDDKIDEESENIDQDQKISELFAPNQSHLQESSSKQS
jgi:hypothetical protein